MTWLIHKLAHLTGWNLGRPISWWGEDGYLWHAFKCGRCGEVQHAHRGKVRKDS